MHGLQTLRLLNKRAELNEAERKAKLAHEKAAALKANAEFHRKLEEARK